MYDRVELIGTVTKKDDLHYTGAGTPVISMTVMTVERKSKSLLSKCPKGWSETSNGKCWEVVCFWRATAWGGLAEAIHEYTKVHALVFISGDINGDVTDGVMRPHIWTGGDGISMAGYGVTVIEYKMLRDARHEVEESAD
jgi:hypothetical protein